MRKFMIGHSQEGLAAYAPVFSDGSDDHLLMLAPNVEKTLKVPQGAAMVLFGFSGHPVLIGQGESPLKLQAGKTLGSFNPAARMVIAGQWLRFVSAYTTSVSVTFYA